MNASRSASSRRSLLLPAFAAALAASLTACVVVPVDPRTGHPYPHGHTHDHGSQPASVTVVHPPAPVAGSAPQASVLSARLYPLNTQANKGGSVRIAANHEIIINTVSNIRAERCTC